MGAPASPRRYDSDLTDAQWAQLVDLVPAPKHTGPKAPKYDRRDILNAMNYRERTGCQWRMLPKDYHYCRKAIGGGAHRRWISAVAASRRRGRTGG